MKCSDCMLFRTGQCRDNPEGRDLDYADAFACFVPGGKGASQLEDAKPKPAAKVEKKPKEVEQAKPPPVEAEREPQKAKKAKAEPVKAAKEPEKAEEVKPEPVAGTVGSTKDQRRKRKPAAVTATGDRAPWEWGTVLMVSFFGGLAAAGIIAGVNWKRLGRTSLMLPTIIVLALAFAFWLYLPQLSAGDTLVFIPISILVNTSVAWGLWLWQRSYYEAWTEANPAPRPSGWLLPALTLAAVWVIVIIIFVLYNFV